MAKKTKNVAKTARKPKIIQVSATGGDGYIVLLYDDGRVFERTFDEIYIPLPDGMKQLQGLGHFWHEIKYPLN
jgi:hypothetical protein